MCHRRSRPRSLRGRGLVLLPAHLAHPLGRRLCLETLAESSLSGKARRNTGISGREPGSTSGSRHGVGDLFTALRRQGLIADELVLQLTTFLRSLGLFLELIVLAPRTFTAKQVRHGGKQGTDHPEHSRIHSSTCPALTSLPRNFPAQRLTISLTWRSVEPLPLAY